MFRNNAANNTAAIKNNEELEVLENILTCPLSQVPFVDPVVDGCGHTFERNDITKWINTKEGQATCPIDPSQRIHLDSLRPNYVLKHLLATVQTISHATEVLEIDLNTAQVEIQDLKKKLQVAELVNPPPTTAAATSFTASNQQEIDATTAKLLKKSYATAATLANKEHHKNSLLLTKAILTNSILKRIASLKDAYRANKRNKAHIVARHKEVQTSLQQQVLSLINGFLPGNLANKHIPESQVTTAIQSLNNDQAAEAKSIDQANEDFHLQTVKPKQQLAKLFYQWHQINSKAKALNNDVLLLKQEQGDIVSEAAHEYSASTAVCKKRMRAAKPVLKANLACSSKKPVSSQDLINSVKGNDLSVAKICLENGLSPNVKNADLETPLGVACKKRKSGHG